jgi:putative membrane protein
VIALSGLLVMAGVIFIKAGQRGRHKLAMCSAAVLAVIFVALYVVRTAYFPATNYAGEHRIIFLAMLGSHTLLSLVNLPLAVITLYLAFKGRFDGHKRIAPYTAAVWVYVALSGWLIFFFNK